MSVVLGVFLESAKLPTASAWAAAIRSHGFALTLDAFDVRNDSARTFLEAQQVNGDAIGARDLVVSLISHSDMRELLCKTIAGAVLCAMTDGGLWDAEGGEWISSADAMSWARDLEIEIRR